MATAPRSPKAPGTKEPKYSRFTQQELPAYKPLLAPNLVVAVFALVATVFIPVGAVCLAASLSVVEIVQKYDDVCVQGSSNAEREDYLQRMEGNGFTCTLAFRNEVHMKAPIFVYYQLNNFFQNHRRYVKSRNDQQLRGESVTNLDSCEPQAYLGGDRAKPIKPCGLVSWTFFNDTYLLTRNSEPLAINERGIAWRADKEKKFASIGSLNFNTDPALRGGGTITSPLNEDEHYVVWMRTAPMPQFRKLWGRIEEDIPAGTNLTLTIQNRYNTYRFDGGKAFVLSTMSWMGGRNDFLGIAYLTVGSVSLFFGLIFFVLHWQFPRTLGDVSRLSWNRRK